jgi:SecD/SecF fusion protein
VFIVVLLLLLFGGGAIKGFAFGMLMGVIFGTYSSIFIASALVVDFTKEEVISGKAVEAKPVVEKPSKTKKEKA